MTTPVEQFLEHARKAQQAIQAQRDAAAQLAQQIASGAATPPPPTGGQDAPLPQQ